MFVRYSILLPVAFLVSGVLGSDLHAAVSPPRDGVQGRSQAPVPALSQGEWRGTLGISSLSYANIGSELQRSQFTVARLRGQYASVGSEIETQVDARLGLGLDCGLACSSVEFPQISIGSSRRLGPVSLHVGRILLPWSLVDDEWAMGVFQPRFIYDFLHPQKVGLAGGFLQFRSADLQLTVFAAPGFVPDRSLPVNVENGRIGSIDPFFHTPISEVNYEGTTTPIAYHLNRGSLSELLLRPAAGVTAQWGGEEGFSASTSYAYKPVNQVLLAYNNLYNLSFEVADADIYPRVVMHHAAAADLRYSVSRATGTLSVIREVPVMDRVPSEWTSQQLAPAWILSPQISWRGRESFESSASYLRVDGGNAPDLRSGSGPKLVGDGSVFNPRYPFTSALKFSASDLFWKRGERSLGWKSQVILDLEHRAQAYLHSVAYQPSARWQLRLATDILVSASNGSDFISRNRANDRFFGAVNYVF